MNKNSKDNWYLVTIKDPEYLSGYSTKKMIQLLSNAKAFKFVILDCIDGSGKDWVIYSLKTKNNTVIKIDDLLKIFDDVNQFDWGDFFLFTEFPQDSINPKKESYAFVISQTNTTLRAVDNTHFYIYTPFKIS